MTPFETEARADLAVAQFNKFRLDNRLAVARFEDGHRVDVAFVDVVAHWVELTTPFYVWMMLCGLTVMEKLCYVTSQVLLCCKRSMARWKIVTLDAGWYRHPEEIMCFAEFSQQLTIGEVDRICDWFIRREMVELGEPGWHLSATEGVRNFLMELVAFNDEMAFAHEQDIVYADGGLKVLDEQVSEWRESFSSGDGMVEEFASQVANNREEHCDICLTAMKNDAWGRIDGPRTVGLPVRMAVRMERLAEKGIGPSRWPPELIEELAKKGKQIPALVREGYERVPVYRKAVKARQDARDQKKKRGPPAGEQRYRGEIDDVAALLEGRVLDAYVLWRDNRQREPALRVLRKWLMSPEQYRDLLRLAHRIAKRAGVEWPRERKMERQGLVGDFVSWMWNGCRKPPAVELAEMLYAMMKKTGEMPENAGRLIRDSLKTTRETIGEKKELLFALFNETALGKAIGSVLKFVKGFALALLAFVEKSFSFGGMAVVEFLEFAKTLGVSAVAVVLKLFSKVKKLFGWPVEREAELVEDTEKEESEEERLVRERLALDLPPHVKAKIIEKDGVGFESLWGCLTDDSTLAKSLRRREVGVARQGAPDISWIGKLWKIAAAALMPWKGHDPAAVGKYITAANGMFTLGRNIVTLGQTLVEGVKALCDGVSYQLTGKRYFNLLADEEERWTKWAMDAAVTERTLSERKSDPGAVDMAKSLLKEMAEKLPSLADVRPGLARAVESSRRILANTLEHRDYPDIDGVEPILIWVTGPPGKGKTVGMDLCAKVIAEFYGEKPVTVDFKAEAFNDLVFTHKVGKNDDMLASLDPLERAAEMTSLLTFASPAAKPINKAFDKLKDVYKILIQFLTSNVDTFCNCGLTDARGPVRRMVVARFEAKKEALGPDGMWKYTDAEEDPDKVWTVSLVNRNAMLYPGGKEPLNEWARDNGVPNLHPRCVLAISRLAARVPSVKIQPEGMKVTEFVMLCLEMMEIGQENRSQNARAAQTLMKGVKALGGRAIEQRDASPPVLVAPRVEGSSIAPSIEEPLLAPIYLERQGLHDMLEGVFQWMKSWTPDEIDANYRFEVMKRHPQWFPYTDEALRVLSRNVVTLNATIVRNHVPQGLVTVFNDLPTVEMRWWLGLAWDMACWSLYGVAVGVAIAGIGVAVRGGTLLANKIGKAVLRGGQPKKKELELGVEAQAYEKNMEVSVRRMLQRPGAVERHVNPTLRSQLIGITRQIVRIFTIFGGHRVSGFGMFVDRMNVLVSRHQVQLGKVFTDHVVVQFLNGQTYELSRVAPTGKMYEVAVPEDETVDVAVLNLCATAPTIPNCRNVVSYFCDLEEAKRVKLDQAKIMWFDSDFLNVEDLKDPRFRDEPLEFEEDGEHVVISNVIEYWSKNSKGMSGALVGLDTEQARGTLVGVHAAGDTARGFAVVVTQELLRVLMRPADVRNEGSGPLDVPPLTRQTRPDFLPKAVEYLGDVPPDYRMRLPKKTKIVPSLIASELPWKVSLMPALLGPVGSFSPMAEAMKRMTEQDRQDCEIEWATIFPLNMAVMVGPPVWPERSGGAPFLTTEEAIEGVDGTRVHGIDETRSAGWPLNVGEQRRQGKSKKGDYTNDVEGPDLFAQQTLETDQSLEGKGTRPQMVVGFTLKDETRPITGGLFEEETERDLAKAARQAAEQGLIRVERDEAIAAAATEGEKLPEPSKPYYFYALKPKKTRGFSAVDVVHTVQLKEIYCVLAMAMAANRVTNNYGAGFTPTKRTDVDLLVSHLKRPGKKIGTKVLVWLACFDFKSNDLKRFRSWKKFIVSFTQCWYALHFTMTEKQLKKIEAVLWDQLNALVLIGGSLYYYGPMLASGIMNTLEIGSVLSLSESFWFIWKAMERKGRPVPMEILLRDVKGLVVGDDTCLSVPEYVAEVIKPIDLKEEAARHGREITSPTKKDLGSEYCTFVDAQVVKRTFRFEGNLAFMPLDRASILGNLAWQRERGDSVMLAGAAMTSALREAFLHGQKMYEEMVKVLTGIAAKKRIPLRVLSYQKLLVEYLH